MRRAHTGRVRNSVSFDTLVIMNDAARYRQFAAQCEQAATLVSRADQKAVLRDMAREWNKLADAAEARGDGPPG